MGFSFVAVLIFLFPPYAERNSNYGNNRVRVKHRGLAESEQASVLSPIWKLRMNSVCRKRFQQ